MDQERKSSQLAAGTLYQLRCCTSCSTGSEEIVVDEDPLSRSYGIGVHFDLCRTVFERIRLSVREEGQPASLSHRNKTTTELMGEDRTQDKSACFNACHRVNLFVGEVCGHSTDDLFEQRRLCKQRRNVLKDNAGLWVTVNIPNGGFYMVR